MLQSPRSLTATVHVKFNYSESESNPVGKGTLEMLAGILDHASDMDPKLQELLVSFADYLQKSQEGAEPR